LVGRRLVCGHKLRLRPIRLYARSVCDTKRRCSGGMWLAIQVSYSFALPALNAYNKTAFFSVGWEPCESASETEVAGQSASVQPYDASSMFSFQSDDDVRHSMIPKADVATVIASYEKTIGADFRSVVVSFSVRFTFRINCIYLYSPVHRSRRFSPF